MSVPHLLFKHCIDLTHFWRNGFLMNGFHLRLSQLLNSSLVTSATVIPVRVDSILRLPFFCLPNPSLSAHLQKRMMHTILLVRATIYLLFIKEAVHQNNLFFFFREISSKDHTRKVPLRLKRT